MAAIAPEYVAARRVLLDARDALAPQRQAVIVVGAQAIYLRTGEGEVGIAPYTTDADLALDPRALQAQPPLEAAMRAAEFTLRLHSPGVWVAIATIDGTEAEISVDLMVPSGFAPPGGRRGARLGPHGKHAARLAVGLEAALVDHSSMTVSSFEPTDRRKCVVEVAGAAALFVAKAHKIHDRLADPNPGRAADKDAADLYGLMQATATATATAAAQVAARLAELRAHEAAGPVTEKAISYLIEMFGRRNGPGVRIAARALELVIPEAQVATLATSYIDRLTGAGAAA